MVNHRLKQFLEKNSIISPNQAGFRNKRECLDQVARIENEVRNINNKNYGVLAVFLDIEKAFDTACRPLILKILKESGIKGQMYNYIRAFLSNRTFRVKIGSELSEYRPLKNGVPQGAVLSPTLFLPTLNFFKDNFFPKGSNMNIAQFADDTALFSKIKIDDLMHFKGNKNGKEANDDVKKLIIM